MEGDDQQVDLSKYDWMYTHEAKTKIIELNEAKLTPFIIETEEQCPLKSFYRYKANLCEVGAFVCQTAMKTYKGDIGEEMRRAYVGAAACSRILVYDLGQAIPVKWKSYCSTSPQKFNPAVVFDQSKARLRENFAKIVKVGTEEDENQWGHKEFAPPDELFIAVLIDVSDTERIPEVIADARKVFPNFDKLFNVILNKNGEAPIDF